MKTDAIVQAFDRLVARDGSKTIVAAPEFRVSVTDLDALSRAAGRVIADRSIPPGAPLGLLGPNGPGLLAGFVACRRAGHATVLIDGGATDAEINSGAETLGLAGVLRVREIHPRRPEDFRIEAAPDVFAGMSGPAATTGAAVVKMTSGSAGRPRGVATSSEALLADDASLRAVMGIGNGDRLMAMVPFTHSYGLSSLVVPALVHGIPLVIPGNAGPFALIEAAAQFEATVLPTVPSWVAAWLRLTDPTPMPPSVRLVITAGAPLLPQTAHDYRRRVGRGLHVFYGASETGGIAYDPSGEAGERGTVGEPIPGVKITLQAVEGLDPASGGRVVVESDAVALDYVPVPESHLRGGRFVSQDLARRRGAELQLLGRLDNLINVRGRKVNASEVEHIIAGLAHVDDVVVHALDGSSAGEPRLCALVACSDGSVTAESVVTWCRGRLASYKIPRRVVVVPALPRTPRGKIDRAAIAASIPG